MSRNVGLDEHYMNSDEIPENLLTSFLNEDGLSYEEILLQQASIYQSFREGSQSNNMATLEDDIGDQGYPLAGEPEHSRHNYLMAQGAIDEALARSLQELGVGFDDLFTYEHTGNASGSNGDPVSTNSTAHASSSNPTQDYVDPDSPQSEEHHESSESDDVETRGIPASRISQFPTSKYRCGLFSKFKRKEKCVICQMNFSGGERLIALPCLHRYHSKCISHWLKLNKKCPICQKEVI